MAKSDSTATVEVILEGEIAGLPLTLSGKVEEKTVNGQRTRIAGDLFAWVTIDKKLSLFLTDLGAKGRSGAEYKEAAPLLQQLLGGIDITLEKLGVAYRNSDPKFAQTGLLISVGKSHVQFALLKNIGKPGYIVGLDVRADQALVQTNLLSGLIGDISLRNLSVYYASDNFANVVFHTQESFRDATQFTIDTQAIVGRNVPKGFDLSVDISLGKVNLLDLAKLTQPVLPISPSQPDISVSEKTQKAKEDIAKGTTFWIEANKAIGPVSVRRVGLSYIPSAKKDESTRIGIKLDAGLQLSVLTLSLEGLGLSYPIDKFSTKPKEIWENLKFHLDGAALAFSGGPLTIGGGLIKVEAPKFPDRLQLDGFLLIRTEIFTITALGSYADMNGEPSLFVFAALQKELGGPPFFFITGLAVGFGINREFKLPPIEDVHNFPLLKAATDPTYLTNLDLRTMSARLSKYIPPAMGSFWGAAGIQFMSFGQIESFAMLSVSVGTQFEIALLGMSRIRVPKLLPGKNDNDVPAIIFAELAFKVAFSTASGMFGLEARLTENSFVLRQEFRLRGGFAFYLWFSGAHAGDFVVTLGGYHPRFKPPAHYPKPDLVEFTCKIGELISISGHCYFALCPSGIMAGGGLSLVFQLGGLRAWFIAQADFLIQWKPVYYDIALSVSIGVALRLDSGSARACLSFELGAGLKLHGPPLGGTARISLAIISFDIEFGEAKQLPPPLLWESLDSEKSFAKAFLPNPKVTAITITDGLLKERKTDITDNEGNTLTISYISPQKLNFNARTLVPATHIEFNGHEIPVTGSDGSQRWATDVGVRPMAKTTMYSCLTITLVSEGNESPQAQKYVKQYVDVTPVTTSVPRALWGKPITAIEKIAPPAATAQMIDKALMGIEIKTTPGPRPWETPVLELDVLAFDRYAKDFTWSCPTAKQADSFKDKTIANTITAPDVVKLRSGILAELARTRRKIMNPEDIHLDQLSQSAPYIFQDMPAMARVGQYPPRGYLEILSG
jgi:hypothetical protein